MKKLLFFLLIISIVSCSKNATIDTGTLNGTYKGELWIYPWAYVAVYPKPLTLNLNNGNWSATTVSFDNKNKSENGTYSLTDGEIEVLNSIKEPVIPSSRYKYTVKGDSLYLSVNYSDGHPISGVRMNLKLEK